MMTSAELAQAIQAAITANDPTASPNMVIQSLMVLAASYAVETGVDCSTLQQVVHEVYHTVESANLLHGEVH